MEAGTSVPFKLQPFRLPAFDLASNRGKDGQPKRIPMKSYHGRRTDDGVLVTVDDRPLNPRWDLYNHSPNGFEWGYGGSGPAQLALAIVADHLGDDEKALAIYQSFKFSVIAALPEKEWKLSSDEIEAALQTIHRQNAGNGGVR